MRGGPTSGTPFPQCQVVRTDGRTYEGRIETRSNQRLWFVSKDGSTQFRADLQAQRIEQWHD